MIGELFLALTQLSSPRAVLGRVEIDGPSAGISIELPGAGSASLAIEPPLVAGERRQLELAVPLAPDSLPDGAWSRAVGETLVRDGRARLVELSKPVELGELPAELLARPRPVLGAQVARAPWSALFVLGAAFAITLSRRRQIVVVSAIALLACASVLALTLGLRPDSPEQVRLLDARLGIDAEGPWLDVRASRDSARVADLASTRIEVAPRHISLACESGSPSLGVSLRAPGATLYQLRAFDPGTRRLAREVNAFASFEEVWLREADGAWRAMGPWPLGEPLPQGPSVTQNAPPGWLVPVLPMGISIFLARTERPLDSEPTSAVPAGATWVRGLGL